MSASEVEHTPEACYERPYLLDTPEKVEWANEHVKFGHTWRLYDSCHHRPAAEKLQQ